MRFRLLIGLVPLAFVALAAGPAAADASPPTFPILPNQYFDGVVNGKTAAAIVYTVCPGPSTGRTGHPASGQTLSVTPASSSGTASVGFTGSVGNSVAATPVTNVANTPVVFVEYFRTAALPTAWTVPCDGDGKIAFTPLPGSSTARTDYVTVRYINIAVAPI
jgi:hypothetical protein